eukprot:7398005-Pyramimonas_sp.AAC.1
MAVSSVTMDVDAQGYIIYADNLEYGPRSFEWIQVAMKEHLLRVRCFRITAVTKNHRGYAKRPSSQDDLYVLCE